MNTALRTTIATAGAVMAFLTAGTAMAGPTDPEPPEAGVPGDPDEPLLPPDPEVNPDLDLPDLDLTVTPPPPDPPCGAVDLTAVAITIADNGDGTAWVQLGYFADANACNAEVAVTSLRTNASNVEHDELEAWSTDVNALEAAAAGDGWVETSIVIDACYANVTVRVDGEWLHEELFGDGCSITVVKEFPDEPWPASISLVHTDAWTADHVLDAVDDDMATWSALPSGEYVVNEYEGAVEGTTIAIDGAAAAYPGGDVAVSTGDTVVFTNPAPDAGKDPDPDPDPDPGCVPPPTEPSTAGPSATLPTTGASAAATFGVLGVVSGLTGLGLVGVARRRRRR